MIFSIYCVPHQHCTHPGPALPADEVAGGAQEYGWLPREGASLHCKLRQDEMDCNKFISEGVQELTLQMVKNEDRTT